MADRFPLIANSSSNQIQELASGDSLDLTGNNVTGAGIITATTFSGALSGNATGLSGTPELTVSTLTGVAGTFTGNLSVEGVLTYEDVTNVDSIGVITARTGVHVNDNGIRLGVGATIDSSGDNILNFFTNAEERARINADGQLLVGATAQTNSSIAEFSKSVGSGADGCRITVENTSNDNANNKAELHLETNNGRAALIRFNTSETWLQSNLDGNSDLILRANGNGNVNIRTGTTEKVRVTNAGNVGINTDNPGFMLDVGNNGQHGSVRIRGNGNSILNITAANDGIARLEFGDVDDDDIGRIYYGNNDNSMRFTVNGTERLAITNQGNIHFKNSALIENGEVSTSAAGGVQNFNLTNGMILLRTTASTGTWTPNFRIDGSNTLNGAMDTGDVVSPTLIAAKGATTHFSNSIQIDGNAITPEFLGGAPTSGGASGTFDIYSYTIIKTADATFTVFASVSNYE